MKTLLGIIVLTGPLFFLVGYLVLAIIVTVIASRKGKEQGKKHWGRNTALIFIAIMFWDLPIVRGTLSYQCDNNAGFILNKTVEQWKAENPGVAETLIAYSTSTLDQKSLPPQKYRYKIEQIPSKLGRDNGRWEYYRYPSGIEVRAEYNLTKGQIKEALRGKLDTVKLLAPGASHIDSAHYLNQRFAWITKYRPVLFSWVEEKVEEIVDLESGEVLARYIDYNSNPSRNAKDWEPWNVQHLKAWLRVRSCEHGQHYYEQMRFNSFYSEAKNIGSGK